MNLGIDWLSGVSSLVIASPVGTLLGPLAFLFLVEGPDGPDGDACRDRFRGVMVAEVLWETTCDDGPELNGGCA